MNRKKKLGKEIKEARQKLGVSTYDLEKAGVHPSAPSTIEKGKKGYTIDTMFKYLDTIEDISGRKIEITVKHETNKPRRKA